MKNFGKEYRERAKSEKLPLVSIEFDMRHMGDSRIEQFGLFGSEAEWKYTLDRLDRIREDVTINKKAVQA